MNDSTLMMIPTAAMDDAFKRDGSSFYVGPGGSGAAIGKRYEQFQQWISEHDQYDLPEVGVRDNGRLGFTNGRHRYAVFRDAGVDPMPVAMGNHDIENAKKIGGVIREALDYNDEEMEELTAKLRAVKPKENPYAHIQPRDTKPAPKASREFEPQRADYSEGANTFYHVSENIMAVGTIIKPQGNTWVEEADKAIEQFRPKGFPKRTEVVFMFPSFDDADHVGLLGTDSRVSGYLYEVEPVGERSWHHVYWYDEIIRDLRDNAQEANQFVWNMVKDNASKYWTGEEAGDHGWEIMAPAAKVVKYLGPAEDVMYGEDSEWFESSNSNAAKGARAARLLIHEMADPKQISAAVPQALAMFKAWLLKEPNKANAITYFKNEEGVDQSDPKFAEKFAIWKEGHAQRQVGKAIKVLKNGMEFRDGKLMIYRAIDVDTDDFLSELHTRGLGRFWSWQKGNAVAYNGLVGTNDINVHFTGAVDPVHIDWAATILANAGKYAHETEITIPEGTPVKILNIDKDGESVDPSLYGGRGRTLMSSIGEGMSVQMSSDEMIAYLRQHHDANLHQDYIDHIHSFDGFVLRDIPIASIAKTELAGLEPAKVEQYKGMDFSKSPPIVMGGGYILDGYHRVSVAKALGVPSIKGYVGISEGVITELRDKTYQYIKSLLPKWPDYILKDLVYPNVKRSGDIKEDISFMLRGMGLSADTKWQLIPDMQFAPDMWNAESTRMLKSRAAGDDMGMQIPRDAERHDTQAQLAQQQGGVRDEPVIMVKHAKGYELIEGWHRTVQHFAKYPQGYTGPAWVAQS
jgi:hypothetical protein